MRKTIYSILACMSLTAFASSCTGFLDSFPSYAVDPNVSVSDSVAIALTNGCYTPLQSSNLYNQRIWSLDIIAGNSEVGAGGGEDGIETVQVKDFSASSDNGFALYIWRSPWVGISQCNLVLNSVPTSTLVSESIRNRSMGEAYFLRAHYYYILVRLFGGVPIRTKPHDASESTDIARNTLDECYDRIIKDCREAVKLLPPKSTYSIEDKNRIGQEAALAMLADILLTYKPESHYAEVVTICDQIAALGYDLTQCEFEDNFGIKADNSKEALFTVGYSGSTDHDFWSGQNQSSWLSTFMGPRNSNMVAGGGWGWNQPTAEFMSQWESGDKRKAVTVFYKGCPRFDGKAYNPDWSSTGYNVRKFLVTKSDSPEYNTNPSDFVVYRYADVLLKKAEALNEQGFTDDACEPLNIVRRRAGLSDIPAGTDQKKMREIIIKERRMELAFEGHRWFDMLRINDGEYAMTFLQSIGRRPTKDRLLLPIPQTEMDSNDLMKQNKGY
ncbi:MAG: RagB/SusD family nutrient uptake outer membrane protein [Bacteroidales bacterium]|nr:RagB/SusD family nutrient uptake outer membrane protein [Bacteroidales bacterium]